MSCIELNILTAPSCHGEERRIPTKPRDSLLHPSHCAALPLFGWHLHHSALTGKEPRMHEPRREDANDSLIGQIKDDPTTRTKPPAVADVACGNGIWLTQEFKSLAYPPGTTVHGFDISDSQLPSSNARPASVTFSVLDALHLSSQQNTTMPLTSSTFASSWAQSLVLLQFTSCRLSLRFCNPEAFSSGTMATYTTLSLFGHQRFHANGPGGLPLWSRNTVQRSICR